MKHKDPLSFEINALAVCAVLAALVSCASPDDDYTQEIEKAQAERADRREAVDARQSLSWEERLACLEDVLGVTPFSSSGGARSESLRIFYLEGYLDVRPNGRSLQNRLRLARLLGAAKRKDYPIDPCLDQRR